MNIKRFLHRSLAEFKWLTWFPIGHVLPAIVLNDRYLWHSFVVHAAQSGSLSVALDFPSNKSSTTWKQEKNYK